MSKDLLAAVVSRMFSLPVLLFFALVLILFKTNITPDQLKRLVPLLAITYLFIPGLFFTFALSKGWVTDIDVRNRRERLIPYTVGIFSMTIGIGLTRFWSSHLVFNLLLIVYLLSVALTMTTFFWKISVHAAINTAFYLLINYLYTWRFWWLFPLIFLVLWARWYGKNHGVSQLLGGVLLAGVVVQGGLMVLFR